MDTPEKSQRQGSRNVGTETTISPSEIDRIFEELSDLYTEEAQQTAKAVVEALGRMLSTGSFSLEDVNALTTFEELLDEAPDCIESMRERVAALCARL